MPRPIDQPARPLSPLAGTALGLLIGGCLVGMLLAGLI